MAITVGIFAESGQGKTTSIIVNPDGTIDEEGLNTGNKDNYFGMNPESTILINSDRKAMPFKKPTLNGWVKGQNVFWESDVEKIKFLLLNANKHARFKSIFIDTLNGIMLDKEMADIKKKNYDKWTDLAQGIYDLIVFCNTQLRDDVIVYLGGHVGLYTDTDGNEAKTLITNGRKLEKIKLETKLPIVLFGSVQRGEGGQHKYCFETQANRSTAKSPVGMFDEFLIPNSLKLVDDAIRSYYEI